MSTRARFQNANDSKSLWNFTMCPGWTRVDAHALRLAIMKYGCGAWQGIAKHFPLKTCGQLNLQTQRLFGQQSLAEFNKIFIDPMIIKEKNDKNVNAFRKNSCIVNTGIALTPKQRALLREKNLKLYGIPKEYAEKIHVPVIIDPPQKMCHDTVHDDIQKLREMYKVVYDLQARFEYLEKNGNQNKQNQNIQIKDNKNKKKNNKNKNKNTKQMEKKLNIIDIENDAHIGKNSKNMKTKTPKNKSSLNKKRTSTAKKRGQKRKKAATADIDDEYLPKSAKRARLG